MLVKNIHKILIEATKEYRVPLVDFMKIKNDSAFHILIAIILSARTKDEVTTKVIKRLFLNIKEPCDIDSFSVEEIEKMIFPIGFFRNKAKFIKQIPEALKKYDNRVPNTMEDLLTLPGVGRKTANLVLAIAFNIPAICVDVHVHRINNRIGIVKTKNPIETEMELRKNLPIELWLDWNHIFVSLGQAICHPRNPECSICPINKICMKIDVINKR